MTVQFRSDPSVDLVDAMGDDSAVVSAARVSVVGAGAAVYDDADATEHYGLINYLMANRHGTPFEHNSMKFRIEAPIFVFREFHRHRIGWCLPGDAKIAVGTWRNGQTKRIADVYRDWHEGVPDSLGRTRLLPSCRNLVARTLNTETGVIEAARMVDVFQSGIKPIIRVELVSGHVLRCTPEHRVWSPEGWVKAGDVSVNDLLGRQGRVPVGERQGIPKRLREGIQIWTTEQKSEVVQPVDTCYLCGNVFLYEELEVDHVVPVRDDLRLALDPENLRPACVPCHQVKTNTEGFGYGERRRALTLGVRFERVVDVRPDGEEMTYDIEMPAPWHNFIADDFVVHNSYNEMSGRYTELSPVFHIPAADRPLVNAGSSARPQMVAGTEEQWHAQRERMERAYEIAYATYLDGLKAGVAKEVAREVLPVGIYSTMYATANARSIMAFLSLRTHEPEATFVSRPQYEIEQVARKIEDLFSATFPLIHEAWTANGRVAP